MRPLRLILPCLLALGCASPRTLRIRPVASRDLRDVTFLSYSSSRVEGFFDPQGQPCAPFNGKIADFFAGWQSHDTDPICDHDTFADGPHAAALELRWQGKLPFGGGLDLVSGGYAVGAFGRAVARGSHYGDYFAWARVTVEAESPHCRARWASQIAKAAVTGIFSRQAEFSGWSEIPDIHLAGCQAGEPLEVRVQLSGEANRGRIEVDAFGFSAVTEDEMDRMFGVRPRAQSPARTAGSR